MTIQTPVEKRCSVKILTGNQAAAEAAYRSKVQVVSAYPITPQTSIIESLAELYHKAPFPHRFVNVESEHSAMSVCIGAGMTGARTFTATSSQGLALMHELLHWASAQRLPVVMVNVNRALAPGWNIWSDQNDSLSQRDTGWMQLYCESAQEIFDTVIQAYRVAEQAQTPVMVVSDAFTLSHTAEAVSIPAQEDIDGFLPTRVSPFKLDVDDPHAFGGLLGPDYFQEVRQDLHQAHENSVDLWARAHSEWKGVTGRSYGILEPYRCDDADLALVVSGTVATTVRVVVDEYRKKGVRVGSLKVRLFRPTPFEALRDALAGIPKVAVLDRNISFGHHGIFFQEVKSALYSLPAENRPTLFGYILGLGGRDVTEAILRSAVEKSLHRSLPEPETTWLGAKGK